MTLTKNMLQSKFEDEGSVLQPALDYARTFEPDYTAYMKDPNLKPLYRTHLHDHENVVMSFLADISWVTTIVPLEYRKKICQKAWNDGHSNGFSEIYNEMCDLVYIFEN